MSRKQIILNHIDIKLHKILEIGALDSPTFRKSEVNIKYLDYDSKENLVKNNDNPRYTDKRLVEVDYVCSEPKYSKIVNEKFDLIIANHVIEHIPDTISWLNEMSKILTKSGKIFLSIPDKNYTFDIARENTTLFDVISMHHDKVKKPTFKHIVDHIYYYKNIKGKNVWLNENDELKKHFRFSYKKAIDLATKNAALPYADVHCHVYTFQSFYRIILNLIELEYINFSLIDFQNVQYMKNEFHIVLEKN